LTLRVFCRLCSVRRSDYRLTEKFILLLKFSLATQLILMSDFSISEELVLTRNICLEDLIYLAQHMFSKRLIMLLEIFLSTFSFLKRLTVAKDFSLSSFACFEVPPLALVLFLAQHVIVALDFFLQFVCQKLLLNRLVGSTITECPFECLLCVLRGFCPFE
jgi:hypothetical protein